MNHTVTFVKLPRLRKIEVRNYSLFEKNLSFDVKEGLSIFIGANGLGKTTTTNLIIYGIVGNVTGVDDLYFKNRTNRLILDSISEKNASVYLEFDVGDISIRIERDIETNQIVYLAFGDDEYDSDSTAGIGELYASVLTKLLGIDDVEDVAFLLNKFLIREEEGNYLLWDNEGRDQSKLIRLLINEAGFEKEYKELSDNLTSLDTDLKQYQYTKIAPFKKQLDALKKSREEVLKKKKNYKVASDLNKQIDEASKHIERSKSQKQLLEKNINESIVNLKQADAELTGIKVKYESISDRAITLEKQLFSNIYLTQKTSIAVHKLEHYCMCIFCNAKAGKKRVKEIIDSIRIGHKCPICESTLAEVSASESKLSAAEMEELRKQLEGIRGEQETMQKLASKLDKKHKAIQEKIEALWKEHNTLESDIRSATIKLFDLKANLSSLKEKPEDEITSFDSQINNIEKDLESKYIEMGKIREKYNVAKKILDEKNAQLNMSVTFFEDKLNEVFVKYASTYFGQDCKLEKISRKPKESKVELTSYIPSFLGKRREFDHQCSTSQRFMLEYLFRLSIIELYVNQSNNSAFVMMETAEGAFDISNTAQLGLAFSKFGSENNIPLIVIVNFSKPDFVKELGNGIKHSRDRIINFVDIGRLSEQQKKDKKIFQDFLDEHLLK